MKYRPDPITQERAQRIWETKGPTCIIDLTLGEYAYIDQIRESMPGSMVDAFFCVLNGEVKYHRGRHAAHYADVPADVESWHFLGGGGTPRPAWVPADAEYHHGYLDGAGRKFAVWIRSIPAPIGSVCVHCQGRVR